MSTLLTADLDGNPIPSTWQADLENQLAYFTRAFQYRFRALPPEKREEFVQEAIVQLAILLAQHHRLHGGRIRNRSQLVRNVVCCVWRGRSSTRQNGQNSDPLDHSASRGRYCKLSRKTALPEMLYAREDLPEGARLDIEAKIDTLPTRLREYATLAYHGATEAKIRRIMSVTASTIRVMRTEIKNRWPKD